MKSSVVSITKRFEERNISDKQTIVATDSLVVDRRLAYVIFRLTLGVNILIHGVGRRFGSGAEEFAAKRLVNRRRSDGLRITYYFLLRNLVDNHFSFDTLLRHREPLAP